MNEIGNTPADKNYKPSGISRAEEAAKKKYPFYLARAVMSDGSTIDFDASETTRNVFKSGYEQAEKELGWHSVEESLPPIDEEVIVLTDELNTAPIYKVALGHIVDRMHCSDYDGWNIPGVKYWMPFPKLPEK